MARIRADQRREPVVASTSQVPIEAASVARRSRSSLSASWRWRSVRALCSSVTSRNETASPSASGMATPRAKRPGCTLLSASTSTRSRPAMADRNAVSTTVPRAPGTRSQ